jgi:chemotaxis signal transduction protein
VDRECLECTVQGMRLLVPTEDLERVLELPLSAPPPLSVPWVAGLGLLGDRPLVVVSLAGTPRGPFEACRALLLRTTDRAQRFGVLVEEVRAIRTIETEAFAVNEDGAWPCPPDWLTASREGDAQVLKLEAPAVASWLFAAGAALEGVA